MTLMYVQNLDSIQYKEGYETICISAKNDHCNNIRIILNYNKKNEISHVFLTPKRLMGSVCSAPYSAASIVKENIHKISRGRFRNRAVLIDRIDRMSCIGKFVAEGSSQSAWIEPSSACICRPAV
jgi:hypothetical protein